MPDEHLQPDRGFSEDLHSLITPTPNLDAVERAFHKFMSSAGAGEVRAADPNYGPEAALIEQIKRGGEEVFKDLNLCAAGEAVGRNRTTGLVFQNPVPVSRLVNVVNGGAATGSFVGGVLFEIKDKDGLHAASDPLLTTFAAVGHQTGVAFYRKENDFGLYCRVFISPGAMRDLLSQLVRELDEGEWSLRRSNSPLVDIAAGEIDKRYGGVYQVNRGGLGPRAFYDDTTGHFTFSCRGNYYYGRFVLDDYLNPEFVIDWTQKSLS